MQTSILIIPGTIFLRGKDLTLYSHSKLGTFETCKLQYKFRYIDKIKVDVDTIEKHLGKVVHEVLEKLYKDLLMGKMNSKDAILEHYEKIWERGWHDKIKIVKSSEYNAGHYWKRGQTSISDYYDNHYPFDKGKTIGLESRVMFDLDPEGKYKIQGFIDRLVYRGEGIYEIHDYKTASNPPSDESLKQDRQLALYQIFVQEKYPDAKDVKLIWHYLTFAKAFISKRDQKDLDALKVKTIKLIQELEKTIEFPPRENPICPWCDYQALCPVRKHLVKLEKLPLEELIKDDGVQLVEKWVELTKQKREIDKQLEFLKNPIIDYVKKEDLRIISGKTHKLRVTEEKSFSLPGTGIKEKPKRDEMVRILKEYGKYDEVCSLDVFSLKKKLLSDKWPSDLLNNLKEFTTSKTNHRISASKLRDEEIAD